MSLRGEDFRTVGEFEVSAGDEVGFTLSWTPSFRTAPAPLRATDALAQVESFWSTWSVGFKPMAEWSPAVLRSLLTLKALTHRETGGIVAARTTSLPEKIGGHRNWDYRFCWLRDATFTLYALIGAGFHGEAEAWREWLVRAVAGSPGDLQIMYGVAGERRLAEYEVPGLAGYEGSTPVRVGNAAAGQLQLDVYGEVLDALYVARRAGLAASSASWSLECGLVAHLETIWQQPDDGIWEVRGGRKHFTHSKVMAWVAFDRAIRWVRGTLSAIEHNLIRDGFVLRYHTREGADGLPPGEGAFLACSFWLADNYVLQGRLAEARELFVRLMSLKNDVGLLAEEYDASAKRQLGNFPQAFSHLALINTARNLTSRNGPAHQRSGIKNQ